MTNEPYDIGKAIALQEARERQLRDWLHSLIARLAADPQSISLVLLIQQAQRELALAEQYGD